MTTAGGLLARLAATQLSTHPTRNYFISLITSSLIAAAQIS